MILWWIANAVALFVVVPIVIQLANRVIRPGIEIQRYAHELRGGEHPEETSANRRGSTFP